VCLRTSLQNEIDTQERDWPASQPLPDFHCYDMRAVERVGAVTNWNSSVLQSFAHTAAEENQDSHGAFLFRMRTWAHHADVHSPRPLKEHENSFRYTRWLQQEPRTAHTFSSRCWLQGLDSSTDTTCIRQEQSRGTSRARVCLTKHHSIQTQFTSTHA
jgi:hypothetical protein